MRLGEIWVGHVTELSRGLALGTAETWRYAVSGAKNPTGHLWQSTLGGPSRELDVLVGEPSEAEALELRSMWRAGKGGAAPLLWAPGFDYDARTARPDCELVRVASDFERSDVEPGRWAVERMRLEGLMGALL